MNVLFGRVAFCGSKRQLARSQRHHVLPNQPTNQPTEKPTPRCHGGGRQVQLCRARDLCAASCQKYRFSAEETQDELAPILVQLAYAWQLLGRSKEARATYLKVLQARRVAIQIEH